MTTKLAAARVCLAAGIEMVITNGARMDNIYDVVAGKQIGTRFTPQVCSEEKGVGAQ